MVTRLRATSSVLFAAVIMLIASMAPLEPANAQPPEWPNLAFSPIAAELNQPVHITHAGDGSGRIFVVERAGRIRILSGGSLLPAPFLDISSIVRDDGSEEGLLSLAFGPNFDESGQFYVYFTDDRPDNRGNNVMARFSVSNDPNIADPLSEELILGFDHPTYENHNGGQIAFGPDGYLYIGMGDGGSAGDPHGNGQSLDTLLGKMLRIDVDNGNPYAIPPDNPYVNGGGRAEIWATGLRNPWRFSFDALTGDLYIADVGQNIWEEVNFLPGGILGGTNFGWDYLEGNHQFQGSPPSSITITNPVAEYSHSGGNCSITGGHVYRGSTLPEWQGVYVYGDFCTGYVWGLVQNTNGEWNSILMFDLGILISSFGLDEDGEIYAVDRNGNILMLTRK